ncbi:TetR/AcrR family transcriptional regulator [Kutzneria albida]|uniref:Putative transcription regulator n=1 Tax=Kutzneria albida DSM 43870 TaxID=1449976 RepID=W5W4T9_9PSEU|nr:TetR/AcrR family transcriptional regulator [Kutzneria albida]AHH95907.1 putative transcription regulator [Kutzneria albida DSM 43870]
MTADLLALIRDASAEEHTEVLDAALAAFLDYGIRRTSMAEVARRAEISQATLYRRFTQKPELVHAVTLREARRFVTAVDRGVDQSAGAREQVVELFVAFLHGLRRQKLLARLLNTEPEAVLPLLTVDGAALLGIGTDYLAEFVVRLQRAGQVPGFAPEPVAEMIARVALSLALTRRTRIPVDEVAAAREFARRHIVPVFGLAQLSQTPTGSG